MCSFVVVKVLGGFLEAVRDMEIKALIHGGSVGSGFACGDATAESQKNGDHIGSRRSLFKVSGGYHHRTAGLPFACNHTDIQFLISAP